MTLVHRVAAVALVALTAVCGVRAETATPAATSSAEATAPLTVFAAASLKTALDIIGMDWRAETGHVVTFSYAASSAIAKQIEQGAPADICASADVTWMDDLAGKKLIVPESRVSLLGNRLVLIAPKDSRLDLKIAEGFPLLEALGDGRLAMGDPKSVPAGAYGAAALKSLGVWEKIEQRVAGSENVRAALKFVALKEAPLGIVYASDAKSEPRVRIVDTFPSETHPPIVYPFALVSSSKHPHAKEFLDYLSSAKARNVFEAQGFTVLN